MLTRRATLVTIAAAIAALTVGVGVALALNDGYPYYKCWSQVPIHTSLIGSRGTMTVYNCNKGAGYFVHVKSYSAGVPDIAYAIRTSPAYHYEVAAHNGFAVTTNVIAKFPGRTCFKAEGGITGAWAYYSWCTG
jgi:hypothetical protein